MSGKTVDQYDAPAARQQLEELCRRVAELKERVEIVADGARDTCVLISKSELECLEKALEILGDSDAVKDVCTKIAQLAASTTFASA